MTFLPDRSGRGPSGGLGRVVAAALGAGLVAALCSLAVPGAAVATTTASGVTWSADQAPFPTDAVPGGGGGFTRMACPATGWCVAVGEYNSGAAANEPTEGMIVADVDGTFASQTAPLPADASTFDPQVLVSDVACAGVGACVVVGSYTDASGGTELFADTLTAGTWTPATLPLPADASLAAGGAAATAVSCPDAGGCVVVGWYDTTTGTTRSVVDTGTGTAWSAASVPVPSDAYTGDTCVTQPSGATACLAQLDQLWSISCPTADACTAVGTYTAGVIQATTGYWVPEDQGFAASFDGTGWTATALPLPSDANADPTVNQVGVGEAVSAWPAWTVSCPQSGWCAVSGDYYTGTDPVPADLLDVLAGGSWSAEAAPLPADAVTSPFDDTWLTLACSSAGTCTATGAYPAAGQVDNTFLDTLTGGTWTSATAPTPAGAGSTFPTSVACPADGDCVVTGVESANRDVFFDAEVAGTWSAAGAPLPGVNVTHHPIVTGTDVSCPGAGGCAAGVTAYDPVTQHSTLFVETDPSLASSTTTLTVSPVDPVDGQPASLSATVAGAEADPGGTVTFSEGLVPLCDAPVVAGTATCTVAAWPAGSGTVAAAYGGDGVLAPSAVSTTDPFVVVTTSLPTAARGVPYAATLLASASSGADTWKLAAGSNPLPKGLSLGADGTISGVPGATDVLGSHTFDVVVTSTRVPAAGGTATTVKASYRETLVIGS